MAMQFLVSVGQIALSTATATIAFAVYRIQADKLFLDLREKRAGALEAFRKAFDDRLAEYAQMTKVDVDSRISTAASSPALTALWRTKVDLGEWFGDEIVRAAEDAERAINAFAEAKVTWCYNGTPPTYSAVQDLHFAAFKAHQAVTEAAKPYIAAGRRGLPFTLRHRRNVVLGQKRLRHRRQPPA